VNRLGQHTAGHASDVQIFNNNRSEILYQPKRETMLEFVPLVSDSSVNLLVAISLPDLHAAFTFRLRAPLA
jgi:hypothetical protein